MQTISNKFYFKWFVYWNLTKTKSLRVDQNNISFLIRSILINILWSLVLWTSEYWNGSKPWILWRMYMYMCSKYFVIFIVLLDANFKWTLHPLHNLCRHVINVYIIFLFVLNNQSYVKIKMTNNYTIHFIISKQNENVTTEQTLQWRLWYDCMQIPGNGRGNICK